jgi:bifunctional non-homologous end joining protein LigD
MFRKPLSRSKRQYAHIHNSPAHQLARGLPSGKGLPMPGYIEPALATLQPAPSRGERWVHEIKYDGYRFQAHLRESQVQFFTRRGHDWTARLSKLIAPAATLKTHAAILDGEVVVQGEHGGTDFNELERELGKKGGSNKLVFYVFDLLYLDGLDLRGATLIQRKDVLRELLSTLDPGERIKYSEHLEGDGAELRQHACEMGLEGIVSKRKDGRYVSGRTDLWVKAPCKRRDTFAVIGWALKGTKFDGFYLAEERDGKLVYAGKIEGGWSEDEKKDLLARVKPLRIQHPPIELDVHKPKAQWLEPRLLGRVLINSARCRVIRKGPHCRVAAK